MDITDFKSTCCCCCFCYCLCFVFDYITQSSPCQIHKCLIRPNFEAFADKDLVDLYLKTDDKSL